MHNTGWFISEGNELRGLCPRGYCECRRVSALHGIWLKLEKGKGSLWEPLFFIL